MTTNPLAFDPLNMEFCSIKGPGSLFFTTTTQIDASEYDYTENVENIPRDTWSTLLFSVSYPQVTGIVKTIYSYISEIP